jgi:hypothetical protein
MSGRGPVLRGEAEKWDQVRGLVVCALRKEIFVEGTHDADGRIGLIEIGVFRYPRGFCTGPFGVALRLSHYPAREQ